MYHKFDIPIRAGGTGACPPVQPRTATSSNDRSGALQPWRSGKARLGIRCNGRPMQPAALRVLETTWRVWREPIA